MLYYDRIDIAGIIDVNKTSISKVNQRNFCNRCHDSLMFINLSDIAILNIEGSDYCCIIYRLLLHDYSLISKNEAITYCKILI